ncbi:MAG: MaoC family dehydratase [Chloroflexi bacterium]|nr:MaoC family dehydratase [Chloroflexota bacterium]
MQEGQALPELRKSVSQDQINRYAQVSGDSNPIHLDAEAAASSTFGSIVAHGMLVLAFVSEMMAQAFGKSWLESGRLKARFSAPAYPGDEVTTFGSIVKLQPEGKGWRVQCLVGCRRVGGQEVVTGEASVLVAGR